MELDNKSDQTPAGSIELMVNNLTVLRGRKPPPRRLTSAKSDPGFEYVFPD